MRSFGRKALRHYVGRALRSGIVLMYHRVADLETDPELLAVSPGSFAQQLGVLRRSCAPVRLMELQEHIRRSPRRARLVALTFDDGYADNLHQALPLLRAAGIPATVFIVTGQLGRPEEFWWDELASILLGGADLPARLELPIGCERFSWDLPRTGDDADLRWNVLSGTRSPRQAAYKELCGLLQLLSAPARGDVLASLRDWAATDGSGRLQNRALSAEEVVTLAQDGLVEVGAHTMTHPMLSAQTVAVQEEEIEGSKRVLGKILGTPVRCFSYPYGERHDYTSATVRLVKEAGYTCACCTLPRRVFRGTDRYQIPRLVVRDWTGEEFERKLEAFFGG